MVLFRIALSACLALTLVSLVFSQAEPVKEWKTIQPEGEIFTVEMPANVKTDSSLDKSHRRYFSAIDGTFFAIFSEKLGKENDGKKALEFIHGFEQSGTGTMIGPLEGERYEFEDSDGFKHKALSFSTKKRTYVIHAIAPKENAQSVDRFFDSLKINDVKAAETDPATSTIEASLPELPSVPAAKDTASTPQESGYGSGNGPGPGSGNDSVPSVTAVSTPLNIHSKPRAAYTDLARLYWIEGTVVLKVTLLSTGQIGSITVVKKLPFGMTQNAIKAARSIEFEPKKVNGVPVSVTKTIEYNFNIY